MSYLLPAITAVSFSLSRGLTCTWDHRRRRHGDLEHTAIEAVDEENDDEEPVERSHRRAELCGTTSGVQHPGHVEEAIHEHDDLSMSVSCESSCEY